MLEILELVFSATATKDIVPALKHVLIYDGRMQGGDGIISLDAPFENDLGAFAVPGLKFLNAAKACGDAVQLSLTDKGQLSVNGKGFKALIATLNSEDFPLSIPGPKSVPCPKGLLNSLRSVKPFISKDASRPWSMAILLKDNFAYATNNIVLGACPIDWPYEKIALPLEVVEALFDLKEEPTEVSIDFSSVTFFYASGVWIKSQLRDSEWPDVGKMLEGCTVEGDFYRVPDLLLPAVQSVRKFCVNQKFAIIHFGPEGISSGEGTDTASYTGYDLPLGAYNSDMLELVLNHAEFIDFKNYPKPCKFQGPSGLTGIFMGCRK